ncbi:MAG: hypothetical protein NC177_18100 [Ruminococcus flavefaciens]|nr:hypothetical protein [Ruminococcus flavefaciens]
MNYEFCWFEESRHEDALEIAYRLMLHYRNDSYYILKYYEAVRRYEDFRIIQEKLLDLLGCF